jgi:hypothetical protein
MTLGGFCCRPWRGRSAARVAGLPPKPMVAENRTPRIPEPVIVALLRWSLKYIDLFAADIFAARADLSRLEQVTRPRDSAAGRPPLIDRLNIYIGRRCAAGRGIPVSAVDRGGRRKPQSPSTDMPEPAINFHLIALQLGCDKRLLISRPETPQPPGAGHRASRWRDRRHGQHHHGRSGYQLALARAVRRTEHRRRRTGDARQRSSRLARYRYVDALFPAPIANVASGSRGPSG